MMWLNHKVVLSISVEPNKDNEKKGTTSINIRFGT